MLLPPAFRSHNPPRLFPAAFFLTANLSICPLCVLLRCHDRQRKLECCESTDSRCVENTEDWNVDVECSESNDPIAHCVDISAQEVDSAEISSSASHRDQREPTECGKGTQPTEYDIGMFKAAKRREHLEGLVPGTLTPYPWRSIFYGRGRPKCIGRPSSLSSSGHNMVG